MGAVVVVVGLGIGRDRSEQWPGGAGGEPGQQREADLGPGQGAAAAQGQICRGDEVVNAESILTETVTWRGYVPVCGGEDGGKRADLRVDRGDEQRASVAGGHKQVQAPLPPCPQRMVFDAEA